MFCPLWHNQWEQNDATWFIQQSSISAPNQISTFSALGDPTFQRPRVPSPVYQLLSQSSPYQSVLPRSGATRLNQPAGPEPFERARSRLQIEFSLFRDLGDPATRESSSGGARRRSIVGGNLTRVLSTLYLPKLVIRGRGLQTFKSAGRLSRRLLNTFCAPRFVQPEFGVTWFIPDSAARKSQRRQARRAGAPPPETTTPLPRR